MLASKAALRRTACVAPRAPLARATAATAAPQAAAVRSFLTLSPASTRSTSSRSPFSAASKCMGVQLSGRLNAFHMSVARREVVKVPQMAESITEGTLKQWSKKKGDYVEADEEIATIETDKIDVSVNAPHAGTIVETFANEEDTVTVGNDLCKIEPGEAPAGGAKKEEPPKEKKEDKPPAPAKEDKKPAPQPQKTEQPRQPEAAPKEAPKKQEPKKTPPKVEAKQTGGNRGETRVKMNTMRRRIAERLKQSQNTAASLTTFNEIDMSAIMEVRKRNKDAILEQHGVKLGFMSAFAKASCLALKEIPAANGRIEGDGFGDTIVYNDYVDLSVAVATPKGLVTPVVRNVEGMSMIEIEKAIAELGKKARDNKLTLEDMAGGTFTISNGGVFGSLFGTPILNLPGSAILGMHAIKEKPWVVNGKVEIRPIMVVALTYDHRLLDGREAVTFLVRLKTFLENPERMLIGA